MKLKITGRALPKHQQKLQVASKDPMSLWRSWESRQPGFIDFNKTSLFPKPQGLRDLNGNLIQSTVSNTQSQTAFQKPDWMLSQDEMNKLKQNSAWAYENNPEKHKMTGYEKAGLIVGGMGFVNNLLSEDENRRQAEKAKKYGYTDSAYGSYTPSFSRGYQEINRKNPGSGYSFEQFSGRTLAPGYGYAQEGGVLMPDEPMGAYEMDVFNQMPVVSTPPAAAPVVENPVPSNNAPKSTSSGANPLAENAWKDISSLFSGVKHLGIWGDARHRKGVSDHNTGDALDVGIIDLEQGQKIAEKLIQEAKDRNIKYIIWNKQIWNPSISNEWRPYTGASPHTDHVHISFNRPAEAPKQTSSDSREIAYSHNNPLNVHYGEFAIAYGGAKGSPDGGGHVAMFKDLNTGLKANKDLLFGPNYANLPISKARNKWVSGNPEIPNSSTDNIVREMGKDVPLAQLTPKEKDKLFKLFAKWEGKQAYNLIKDMPIFEEGGEYELTEDEIDQILKNGGQIQYL